MEHDTPDVADDPMPYALAELAAYNQGWASVAARDAAFVALRLMAVRVIEWRAAVLDPCRDAVDVQVWAEDRIAAGSLAWPAATDGVPMPARYDLLRQACRLEHDLHQRSRALDLDAIRAAEGEDLPWDDAPTSADEARIMATELPGDRPLVGYSRGATLFAAGLWQRWKAGRAA